MNQPTPLQERILAFVLGYYADNGVSPTREEIAERVKADDGSMLSSGVVHYHTEQLVRMGRLKRTRRSRWRNLAPISAND